MRRRIEQPSCILTIENGGVLGMTQDTYDYISKLKLKNSKTKNIGLKKNLKLLSLFWSIKTIGPLLAKSVMNASLLCIVNGPEILSDAERTQYAMILFRKIKIVK